MKKLTIALALILCLLMCVFCFASCKKKNKTTNETTAATTVEATTAHVHTPAADFTVDQQPTCVRAGSKSKHCTVCNEIIPETVTSVPATGEHTVEEWTETPSTLIRQGSKTGTCTVCHQPVTETFDKTEPIIYLSNWDLATRNANAYTIANPDDSSIKTFGIKKNVKNILGNDGVFYPTEENDKGNDLLIEFSFLYNDTMANAGDGTIAAMYVENNNVFNVNLKTGKITAKERTGDAYILPTPEDIAADETVKQVAIGEYGWHRFGMRIHEDAKIEADAVVYTVTATAYLDGAKIMEVDKTAWATQNFAGDYTGLLYTAEIEEGELTYKNAVDDGKHCDAYVMVEELPKESENPGYLVVGDIAMTCGQEFDQKVFALKDPAAETLEVAEGVTLPASFYYVSEHDHVWDAEPTILIPATLLSDGVQKKTCSICGEKSAPEAYVYEPTKWTYTTETATANKMETKIEDILGEDKHFYPDESNGGEGLDLIIEYSILWNETMLKLNAGSDDMVVYGSLWGQDAYWLSLTNNAHGSSCPYAGGFEFISLRTVEYGPHGMSQLTATGNTGDQFSDFPNIGGADQANPEYGWHRIAVVFHEDVLKDTGIVNGGSGDAINNASYKMTSTCYIDGVKIYTLTNASDAEFKASTMKNGTLLFKTNEADAPFTYTDVAGDKKVTGLEIPVKKTSEGDAYILIADYSVTAGKDFVQKVMRVDDPADATIEVAEGVELPAKVWYTIPFEVPVYNSKSPSGYKYADGDYFFISKSVADIKGDKTFHPTSEDADGNDLWFEYSFLWNDTLENWNQSKSEMSLFGFRNAENKYRDFYYLYTKDGQSGDCPYKGHVDYSTYLGDLSYNCAIDLTSEGNGIGLYKAGWDSPITRNSSPYLYDAESQTTGGWHRLGFRFHQEATVNNEKGGVVYTGYTELFIDGVKVWKVQTDMQGYWKNSQWKELNGYGGDTTKKADLKWNDLLLWYAKTELAPEDNAEEWTLVDGLYYKDNDTMRVQARLDRVAQSTNAVYVAVDEVYWTCGDGFVRNVTPVVTPAAKTITLDYKGTYEDASDDLTASAAVFFRYAD